MVACDEPYIGELSIILPPPAANAFITPAHSSSRTGSLPTLKVIHEPSPTHGIRSPEEGIGLVAGWADGAAETQPGAPALSAAAAAVPRNVRLAITVLVAPLAAGTGELAPPAVAGRQSSGRPAGFASRNRSA